jgi:hypothetical protein
MAANAHPVDDLGDEADDGCNVTQRGDEDGKNVADAPQHLQAVVEALCLL